LALALKEYYYQLALYLKIYMLMIKNFTKLFYASVLAILAFLAQPATLDAQTWVSSPAPYCSVTHTNAAVTVRLLKGSLCFRLHLIR
jgi:hypothetical protein